MQKKQTILSSYVEKALALPGEIDRNIYDFIEDCASSFQDSFISEERYINSYINPAVTVPLFGEKRGRVLSAWCFCVYQALEDWSLGEKSRLSTLSAGLELIALGETDQLIGILKEDFLFTFSTSVRRMLDEEFSIDSGESIQKYGIPVSSNELGSSLFLKDLSFESINRISDSVVSGYIKGFRDDNKEIELKETVALSIPAGYERIAESLRQEFLKKNLRMKIWQVTTTGTNLQMMFDHKFDWALFIDDETVSKALEGFEGVLSSMSEEASLHSGRAYVMTFGDKRSSPSPSTFAVKPDASTSKLFQNLQLKRRKILNLYVKKEETSYTGVAFPVPDIGANFKEIFMDTLALNTLDSSIYCQIQDLLIDALDQADFVHVTGRKGNDTDIRVQMHKLQNPARETTFLNCLSTVNIPLGEVFTSPLLKGTNGVLHVEESFISGILYKNLRLSFKDGYIQDYSCTNFCDEAESRNFVYETLIHPNDTLPMGEFAIGTNTLAYSMALKHGIMNKLPVLIAEKMGPHFAIGDTCFAGGEDHPCRNPSSGKEMVARFNEKTALRLEKPSEAYTSTHNDITIPYSSLGSVTAVRESGDGIEIISHGRFVLPGTEYLNSNIDHIHTEEN